MAPYSAVLPLLRVFAAAARLQGFSAAASHLGISPSAVTQSIAKLERTLGTALFSRSAKGVALTPAGTRLFRSAATALLELDRTLEAVSERTGSLVRLAAPSTWAALWLAPRLGSFLRDHPDIRLHIETGEEHVDIEAEGIDFAVHDGAEPPGHFKRVGLFSRSLVPVCSPRLASTLAGLDDIPVDRLIHEGDSGHWEGWLTHAGATEAVRDAVRRRPGGLTFSPGSLCVSAAVNGIGIALSEPAFVAGALEQGQLVMPFRQAWPTGHEYSVVWSSRTEPLAHGRRFLDWLKAQATETSHLRQ